MRTEAVTPREVVEQLLRAAGDDLVLVGGQALAFWAYRFNLLLPTGHVAISADTDFLAPSAADRAAVFRMAAVLKGATQFPNKRGMTSLIGQAYLDISDDEFINVDVVHRIIGLTQEAVRKRMVGVDFEDIHFFVMHPLHVLHSRLANLHELAEKQNPKGVMQLSMAIDMAREYIRFEAMARPQKTASGRSSIQPLVSEVERLALQDSGRKVAQRFELYVADAIDPSLIPAGPFWERKWPGLSQLMSPGYASRFRPPVTRRR